MLGLSKMDLNLYLTFSKDICFIFITIYSKYIFNSTLWKLKINPKINNFLTSINNCIKINKLH